MVRSPIHTARSPAPWDRARPARKMLMQMPQPPILIFRRLLAGETPAVPGGPNSSIGRHVRDANGTTIPAKHAKSRPLLQGAVDGGGGVECRGVENRNGRIFSADKKRDFGASQDNALNSFSNQTVNDFSILVSGAWLDDANHQSLAKPVREIKASRNILLHNKLVTNGAYLEQAGESRRAKEEGKKLNIDRTYLDNSVRAFASVVSEMKCLMQAKYASYTKLAAIRRLWDFCFKSPVMPFEDFWTVNEDRDCIVSSKRGRCEDGLSGSETVFLGVWRTHFNAYRPDLKPIYIRGLDEHHQAKLFFLLSVFRHLWLE